MKKLKRYVLFVGDIYYPQGGAHDIHSSYDTLALARAAIKSIKVESAYSLGKDSLTHLVLKGDCWWHVMDTATGTIKMTNSDARYRTQNPKQPTKEEIAKEAQAQRDETIARLKKITPRRDWAKFGLL